METNPNEYIFQCVGTGKDLEENKFEAIETAELCRRPRYARPRSSNYKRRRISLSGTLQRVRQSKSLKKCQEDVQHMSGVVVPGVAKQQAHRFAPGVSCSVVHYCTAIAL